MKNYIVFIFIFHLLLSACAGGTYPISTKVLPSSTLEATYTQSPFPKLNMTTTPSALPIPTLTVEKPPLCKFPLAGTKMEESISENYVFSTPRIVLADLDDDYHLVQWLPDNQQVLVSRDHLDSNRFHIEYQSIELFNPRTGTSEFYASRISDYIQPIWVEGLKAVVYPSTRALSLSHSNHGVLSSATTITISELLISKGNSANVQSLQTAQLTAYSDFDPPYIIGSVYNLAVNSDGSQIVYWDQIRRKLYVQDISQGVLNEVQVSSFDINQWNYRGPSNTLSLEWLSVAWRPSTTQIFFYSDPWAGNYTYLLDIANDQVCEINLFRKQDSNITPGNFIMSANWSPNGRYLAAIYTKVSDNNPIVFSDLIVLDIVTGQVYQVDAKKFSLTDVETLHNYFFISSISWAPDNQHIVAIGQFRMYGPGTISPQDVSRLYLVDFRSDQVVQISSKELWTESQLGTTNVIWANDGSKLLVKCKERNDDALCLLNVKKKVKQ
jgi:hypothetical protein